MAPPGLTGAKGGITLFLESAVLGVIIGFLRGGRLNRLGRIDFRGWPLALAALLLQTLLWIDFGGRRVYTGEWGPYLHLLSYLFLLAFILFNRRQPGLLIIGLGLLLNLLVIAANGGAMPVDGSQLAPPAQEGLLSGAKSPFHEPLDKTTRLPLLGDILRLPYGDHRLVSVGDILLGGGLLFFIQRGMQERRKDKR